MDNTMVAVMHECAERSLAGSIAFPEVVGKLTACGVESYHVDLYRGEETFYLPSGESHVETMTLPPLTTAVDFDAQGVQEAIRESQQGRIKYVDFLHRITAAGTTQYFVYFTGRCAVYVGRDGSRHVEHFPPATS